MAMAMVPKHHASALVDIWLLLIVGTSRGLIGIGGREVPA
jgi:hypothetical protein